MASVWFWSIWGFAVAGLGLLAADPAPLLAGFGHAATPAVVHLLTLGVVLGGYYPLQAATWRGLYGANRFAERLAWPLWGCHVAGTALMAWGLHGGEGAVAYLGGHYLVPFAILFSWIQGGAWLIGRDPGAPRALETHLPGLGLLVAMSMGVMLLLDRASGQLGFYAPATILLHALAAAFLFVLPAQQGTGESPAAAPVPVAIWSAVAGLGLLAIALAREGFQGGAPLGLALLGAVALWVGLPAGPEGRHGGERTLRLMRRLPWAVVGLAVLYAALRLLRGATAAEMLPLGTMTVTIFLLGAALPEWFHRLRARAGPEATGNSAALHYGAQHLGTVVVLGAQLGGWPVVARIGLALWLASLALRGALRLAGARTPQEACEPRRR